MDPEGARLLTLVCAYGKPRLPPVHKYSSLRSTALRAADWSSPLRWTLGYTHCTGSVLVKAQCQVLNQSHERNFDNYSLIGNYFKNLRSTNVYTKFHCAVLRIEKALGIFRELITRRRTTTTRVAFWDPPSGSINWQLALSINTAYSSVKYSCLDF